ncbi:MAG: hypothetical protein JXB07_00845 [Anaerolineae bacterium]|nr:hypothetical protein [Anaerolineae bacterium]
MDAEHSSLDAHYGLGLVMFGLDQMQEAIDLFAQARDLAVMNSTDRSASILNKQVEVLIRRLS